MAAASMTCHAGCFRLVHGICRPRRVPRNFFSDLPDGVIVRFVVFLDPFREFARKLAVASREWRKVYLGDEVWCALYILHKLVDSSSTEEEMEHGCSDRHSWRERYFSTPLVPLDAKNLDLALRKFLAPRRGGTVIIQGGHEELFWRPLYINYPVKIHALTDGFGPGCTLLFFRTDNPAFAGEPFLIHFARGAEGSSLRGIAVELDSLSRGSSRPIADRWLTLSQGHPAMMLVEAAGMSFELCSFIGLSAGFGITFRPEVQEETSQSNGASPMSMANRLTRCIVGGTGAFRGPQASAVAALAGRLVVSECFFQYSDLNGLWVANGGVVECYDSKFHMNGRQGVCVNRGGQLLGLDRNVFTGNGRREGANSFVDVWQCAGFVSMGENNTDHDDDDYLLVMPGDQRDFDDRITWPWLLRIEIT